MNGGIVVSASVSEFRAPGSNLPAVDKDESLFILFVLFIDG